MAASEFVFEASDGARLFARRWLPETPPRAIVQIAHGVAKTPCVTRISPSR